MGASGEWQRGPVIGRGASATVSIATDRRTGDMFAVKSVEVARAGVLRREQSVLSALSSPYIVSCLGSDVSVAADGSGGMRYDLFLQYAPGGSLADEIKRCGGRCEEAVIRSRAGDVLRGLAYVHGARVAHCDVKGRNVLLGADGRAMLADFGCARWTSAEDGNAACGAMIRGTPLFLAPEAARGEAQGTAADIWALGCTVIEMATGGAPWPQRFADPVAALHHVAHSGDVPEPPAWLSDEGKDFLSRCLIRDPAERWTAEQLLEHPFVSSSTAIPVVASKAAPIERRVSPKSVLDQGFWEEPDSATDSDTTVALTPADRVRALAADVAPDWTLSGEHWITVCAHTGIAVNNNDDTAAPPKSDADTAVPPELFVAGAGSSMGESEEHTGGGGEHMGVNAPRGHASSHGHDHGSSAPHGGASSSAGACRSNSVISGSNNDCTSSNSASTGNKGCCRSVINASELVHFRPS
ncbi:mitogen-activated protein kinase kinase kinase 18-like [Phragmites australis]|uniref:mitogen-activated protein kinase kinase kinase 18-like n=1 Tax=Phragmites australis TaxID=29695 RepID=UPI002D764BAA|nr:mitogen-activated protein kinase kinase kinase 18-like [Phragmites australis]